ncbi:immunoglobulin I-set domain-containing protein [Aphelenchoides avenae]|nr:immunoglobulin I-set domain-containing protein [Aphelenchus avenae]
MIASAIYLVFLPTVLTFIVTESGDIEIVEGRHADFPCVLDAGVHGDGNGTEVEWTWRPAMRTFLAREWRVVSQHSNKSRFTFAVTGNNRTLSITDTKLADAGEYRCTAVYGCVPHSYGRHCQRSTTVHNVTVAGTSNTAFISVNDYNTILTCEGVHPQSSTEKHATATLNCQYSSERPKIDFILGKNGIKADRYGGAVSMVCSASGNPPPRLYWLREGREINSTYHYDFETQSTQSIYMFWAKASDNGAVVECVSVNRENVPPLKTSAILDVKYAPSNVYLNGSTTMRRGESMIVTCASSPSNPPSTISWLNNGTTTMPQPQVERSEGHGTVTESIFTVDSDTIPSEEDQLTVECVANNSEGSVRQQHNIRVLSPASLPVIHGFERGPMLEGELLNLTCEAHGDNPPPTLSWYIGMEELMETQSTISGDVAQSAVSVLLDRSMNAQQIRCEAENVPPRKILVRQLETDSHQMVAGEATWLSCVVPSANPSPVITWEFESGNANRVVKHGGYLLNRPVPEYGGYEVENVVTFTPTEVMDGTLARCIASHPLWNDATSQTYQLNVFYAPRIVMDEPATITVSEGEFFHENVTIFTKSPVSSYEWRKNGVAFDAAIGNIHVQGPDISGKEMTPQDAGFYTLVVANQFGSASVSIRLIVEYSARITHVTSPVMANAGEEVALVCEADGVPLKQGMVTWMRENSVLESVQDEKRAVLRLNASQDSSGAYTCMVDNGIGQPNHTTAYLLLKRAPAILRSPGYDRAAAPIGGRATLRCRAVAVPIARIWWSLESESGGRGDSILYNTSKYQFHQVQLDHSTIESTLYVAGLEERDYSRRVHCRAHNRVGDDNVYIGIGPTTAPDIPSHVEALCVKNTSATLRWQPGFDGGSDQLFEVQYGSSAGVKSLNSSSPQTTLTGLDPGELYRVQVRSINMQARTSTFTAPMEFVTLTKEDPTISF